jgi:hypothetical protein
VPGKRTQFVWWAMSHHWILDYFDKDISIGTCLKCGEKKYFADYLNPNTLKKVKALNKER